MSLLQNYVEGSNLVIAMTLCPRGNIGSWSRQSDTLLQTYKPAEHNTLSFSQRTPLRSPNQPPPIEVPGTTHVPISLRNLVYVFNVQEWVCWTFCELLTFITRIVSASRSALSTYVLHTTGRMVQPRGSGSPSPQIEHKKNQIRYGPHIPVPQSVLSTESGLLTLPLSLSCPVP